jgi:hypothetical protein
MIKKIRLFLIIVIILFNPITGFIFGFLELSGAFTRWESLGKPPEMPVEIIAADIRNIGVYVKTMSGNIYECCFGENPPSWKERSESEVQGYNFPDCLMGQEDEGKHLRDEIDNYPVYWCGEWDSGRAYYAIHKDGTVWVLKHSSNYPGWVIRLCGYPFTGLIISIVTGTILQIITKRQTHKNNVVQ